MALARSVLDGSTGLPEPQVRRIGIADLKDAIARGTDDFLAVPTFAVFVIVVYPVIGLLAMRLTFGYQVWPLIFPLVAGFPLVAPFAAIGLYELSRRRERNLPVSWDALEDVHWPCIRAVLTLGLLLLAIFAAWVAAAVLLWNLAFGTWVPDRFGELAQAVLTTPAGLSMLITGCVIGFVFATIAFAISVVSFPLLLDRDVGALTAMRTSVRAVAENPATMTVWAMVIVAALAIGALPAFIGLIVVLPVLGHATWHVYRKVVEPL